MLIVSQYPARRLPPGRRPSWSGGSAGDGRDLYLQLVAAVGRHGIHTATGEFPAMMAVRLTNDSPVTILLDSQKN
jgi:D-tyrosyl-tRNA(Tyr) deacylase